MISTPNHSIFLKGGGILERRLLYSRFHSGRPVPNVEANEIDQGSGYTDLFDHLSSDGGRCTVFRAAYGDYVNDLANGAFLLVVGGWNRQQEEQLEAE